MRLPADEIGLSGGRSLPVVSPPDILSGEVGTRSATRMLTKRALDLVAASVLTMATLPIVLVLATWSAVQFRAWPFFVQDRIGQWGAHFPFVKIRTMPPAHRAYALKTTFTQDDLPWLSRAVRRLHLDELPQLWLVMSGRMSMVGPRPKMPDEFEPVDETYGYLRTRIPQGCTGIWQVSEHRDDLPSDVPFYEYFYLQHGGLRLDLWILWRTALQMVGVGQPVRLSQVPAWTLGGGWVRPRERVTVADAA